MNSVQLDGLNAHQKSAIEDGIDNIIADTQYRASISYKFLTGTSYAVETGIQTRTETTDSVSAVRRVVSIEDASRSGGFLQVGDRIYLIRQSDLSLTPTKNDQITDSDAYEVIKVEGNILSTFWEITARRL